jgi:hypothetical protein
MPMVWAGEAGSKADFLKVRDRIGVELLLKVKYILAHKKPISLSVNFY